jgi:outer membrane protein OmpA-like peptidoglycan-associated protein
MKKILFILLSVIQIDLMAQIPTTGLIGYYPFTGNANNMISTNYYGKVKGAILTTDRFGNANSAYAFDTDKWIELYNSGALPIGGASSFSVSYWALVSHGGIAWSKNGCITGNLQVLNGVYPTYIDTRADKCQYCFWDITKYATTFNSTTWYHIVYVKKSDSLLVYLNGTSIIKKVFRDCHLSAGNNRQNFNIGSGSKNTWGEFNGSLDDFRIYNRALTGAEISQLYTAEKPNNETKTNLIYLKQLKKGATIVLKNIQFNSGSPVILPSSYEELDTLVALLNANPGLNIEIGGHTDNLGDPQKHQELSEQRAKNVMGYLISKGIPEKRLSARGYGMTKPISENNTQEGRAKNRRVEFIVK